MEAQRDYKQMPPCSSEVIKNEGEQQKDNRCKSCCYHFWCWFFQIGVWGFLIASIILFYYDHFLYIATFLFFGLFYIIYITLECCSETEKFLSHKNIKENLKEILTKYITTAPIINFHGRSYHILIITTTKVDENGRIKTTTKREEITSHNDYYNMPFYSSRDVSGLFQLNCNKDEAKKKCYIKLELSEEINLADSISYIDLEREKTNF